MLKLGTKAQTLEVLKNYCEVPTFTKFTVLEFNKDKKKILKEIKKIPGKVIIRSSSIKEDTSTESGAGKYISEILKNRSTKETFKLIRKIILDFKKKDKFFTKNEIIVQKYEKSISISGVILTYDIANNSPYYVINYNDELKSSNNVTSGQGVYANKKIYISRQGIRKLKSPRFKSLLKTIIKIEILFNNNFLDIEFILKKNFKVVILQVRAISNRLIDNDFRTHVDIKKKISDAQIKYGPLIKNNILAQMPDWNPAEIIGENPENLSFSLYKKLVTDKNWFVAREKMGYSNFSGSKNLMISILGKPYIDVKKSFNSFFPKSLSKNIKKKLLKIWASKLKNNLNLHDKIEFEVAITCFDFQLKNRLKQNEYSSLTIKEKNEIISNYKEFTFNSILNFDFDKYIKILNELDQIKYIEKKDFKKQLLNISINGIIPFAILARHAFIGQSLLKSLIAKDIITKSQHTNFQLSYQTITKSFLKDMRKVKLEQLSKSEFMKIYGHLRAGTYNIKSPRYDQMKNFEYDAGYIKDSKYQPDKKILAKFERLMAQENIKNINPNKIFEYIKKSCELREYSKFLFTKQLSQLLENIKNYLKTKKISIDDMAHLSINDLNKSDKIIKKKILKNKKEYFLNRKIKLPQVLFEKNNFFVVPYQINEPNFVSKKTIIKNLEIFNTGIKNQDFKNKIVVIENADPGYDWIFSKKISGLITKYGGANSHMTIRCAELDMPAMIGCGPKIFNEICNSKKIELNCKSKLYNILL
ncbi:PEP-utilizing enzyme [Candidatus Pelagibacter sp. HIMB1587]|uniref:PEP-utilizing enzyme n=1 Tax=Candidatus Pelagibacter sp. HIMB1587 TaxID=3413354 RepID=UPI003F86D43B